METKPWRQDRCQQKLSVRLAVAILSKLDCGRTKSSSGSNTIFGSSTRLTQVVLCKHNTTAPDLHERSRIRSLAEQISPFSILKKQKNNNKETTKKKERSKQTKQKATKTKTKPRNKETATTTATATTTPIKNRKQQECSSANVSFVEQQHEQQQHEQQQQEQQQQEQQQQEQQQQEQQQTDRQTNPKTTTNKQTNPKSITTAIY